ncbi:HNH endonuclease [Pontiella agarivorans]|uniref:HNH endonuclease n=1 Tax=Pontiella agarivorans TaxID=3038953 RepID=A0ABU5MWY7_9BACT|nr:HNH endonuclease [Pontiella agarivorans]MDZ8118735.1 HNH endonuclease [Pontiella agarivorans]
MNKSLRKFEHKLTHLRQGVTKYGPAPHKPVLLLAVMRGLEEGWISGNRIELTPELVGTFKSIWRELVTTAHSPLIAQPFFYLRGEKFWHHIPNPGFETWVNLTRNSQSIGVLQRAIRHAELDPDLFALMASPVERDVLRQTMLKRYFPDAALSAGVNYLDEVNSQILAEPAADYQAKIKTLQETLDKEAYEEEVFVRGGVFKKQVPMIYDNTCCISGLKVETSISASLIDACHIVPFSQSHDDTITNGLALCPTLHRAFDRGLIAINPENYRVIVSTRMTQPVTSTYSIRQFQGLEIKLPQNKNHRPNPQNLARHLKRFADNF